jgi:hypothetical protein
MNTVVLTIFSHHHALLDAMPRVGDGKWYYTTGVSLIMMMIINMLIPPAAHVGIDFAFHTLPHLCRRCLLRGARTQNLLNQAYEPEEWDLATSYGEILFVVWTTLLLCPALPILLPISAAGLAAKYWADKWAVLRVYKKPPMKSSKLFRHLTSQVMLILTLNLMSAVYFLSTAGGVTPETPNEGESLVELSKAMDGHKAGTYKTGGWDVREGVWYFDLSQPHVIPLVVTTSLVLIFQAGKYITSRLYHGGHQEHYDVEVRVAKEKALWAQLRARVPAGAHCSRVYLIEPVLGHSNIEWHGHSL